MAQSLDPLRCPAIRPNYLSAPSDLRVLISGINQTRKIYKNKSLQRIKDTSPSRSKAARALDHC
jgi:hypothetical protein